MEPTASDTSSSTDQNIPSSNPSQNLLKARTSWIGRIFGKKDAPVAPISPVKKAAKQERMTKQVFKELRIEKPVTHKLNSDQVMKLVFWIATFVKTPEIVARVQEEFGISIHPKLVAYYKAKEEYQPVIQKIRDRWGSDLLHVELANKRRRMEELERIYEHCMNTDQIKNALAALFQIKGEVEKDLQNLSMTNYNINIYKDLTEMELEEERMKSLERLKTLKGVIPCVLAAEKKAEKAVGNE